jgi:hypothetical protein
MKQLSLFDQIPEKEKYLYKVRFTNLYGRQCDDRVRTYTNEQDAIQALNDWKNQSAGNTGIVTSSTRSSISGLIS